MFFLLPILLAEALSCPIGGAAPWQRRLEGSKQVEQAVGDDHVVINGYYHDRQHHGNSKTWSREEKSK